MDIPKSSILAQRLTYTDNVDVSVGNRDIGISSWPIFLLGILIGSLVDLLGKATVLRLVIRLTNGRLQYHSLSFDDTRRLIVSERRGYYLLWLDSLVGMNCFIRSVPTASNC